MKRRSNGSACQSAAGDLWRFLLRTWAALMFSVLVWAARQVAQRLGPVTSQATGISFHRVCGWTGQPYNRKGDYTLNPELENAIRDLHLPMTRFYAVGEEPFGLESAIDKVAEICRKVGVAQDHCVLEFEEQDASTKLPPEVWARGIRHSLEKGF